MLLSVNNATHNKLVHLDTNNNQEGSDKQFEKQTKPISHTIQSVKDAFLSQNKTFLSQYLLEASRHAK